MLTPALGSLPNHLPISALPRSMTACAVSMISGKSDRCTGIARAGAGVCQRFAAEASRQITFISSSIRSIARSPIAKTSRGPFPRSRSSAPRLVARDPIGIVRDAEGLARDSDTRGRKSR